MERLKGKRKSYSGNFKSMVITELIFKKKNVDELAEYYHVHPNQIRNWKTILFKRLHLIFEDRRHNKTNNHI
jgi:transposase